MNTVSFTVLEMKDKEKSSPPPIRAEVLRKVSDEISREHPVGRWAPEFSEVVLLEVDTHRIHAYWHVTPADLQVSRKTHDLPNAQLVLRLYDISDRTLEERPESPDVSLTITGLTGDTYFEELESGHVYVADVALLREDGSLVPLIHSNPVHLPPDGESDVYELVVVDTSLPDSDVPAAAEEATNMTAPLPTRATDFRRSGSSPHGEG